MKLFNTNGSNNSESHYYLLLSKRIDPQEIITVLIGFLFVVFLSLCLQGCDDEGNNGENGNNSDEITPVYFTVVGHIEKEESWASCQNIYPEKRRQLMEFAEAFAAKGAKLNLQIDMPFLVGAKKCETPAMRAEYSGTTALNVVDYLAQKYGFEIDPHRSGGYEDPSEPNYADVRQLAGELTSLITETVGGIIVSDVEQFDRLNNGEVGNLPQTTLIWFPEMLTMGVAPEHRLGDFSDDDRTSGIWKPAGADTSFYTHAPDNRMIYVGPGQQHADWAKTCNAQFASVTDYVKVLLKYIDEGKLPANKLYTASVGVPQMAMFGGYSMQKHLFDMIDELQPLVDEGKVIFATYTEVVQAWEEEYGSEPNIVQFDLIDSQDYTCP